MGSLGGLERVMNTQICTDESSNYVCNACIGFVFLNMKIKKIFSEH